MARFIAEAQSGESTWDVYVGMTPFVEMASLIKAGVIEPWDDYIPKEKRLTTSFRPSAPNVLSMASCIRGPFLLDIIVQGYNSNITTAGGLADAPPANWDEFLANSQAVLDAGAARYGCTFDAHGWRSLAPITHSLSTDVYYQLGDDPMGLFDFTSEPALAALEVMKEDARPVLRQCAPARNHRRRRQ